ncbi:hypothetical protein C8Q76DRAFT_801494 [Earliella scabrosa]|nr:hypothetical protein C8Q76DRAFT_801494 [Earliella scabrosa]
MNNSLLPIDISEHIIDSCYVGTWWLRKGTYHTWCQAALVCSAWLPRSQLNLLHEVRLRNASHVDLLLRTVQEMPHFADLIVRLGVEGEEAVYVPFARMPLPRLLKKCVALDLSFVDWSLYPPRYADTGLHVWSNIEELRLDLRASVLCGSFRWIWSLHHLRYLHLGWISKTSRCESLQLLEFMDERCALVPWPTHAFGCSVRRMTLVVISGVSEGTLQLIQAFSELEHLYLRCRLDDPPSKPLSTISISGIRTRTLRSVLDSVNSGAALQSVKIVVQPWQIRDAWSFGVDRAGLVDLLLGVEMLNSLSRFPKLHHVYLTLDDNDPAYDGLWWMGAMARELPERWHASVAVEVRVVSFFVHLWHTREEIEAAGQTGTDVGPPPRTDAREREEEDSETVA